MQIEWCNAESLIPYARNARTHIDEQVRQIAASMVEFGWTNPVLTDGHGGIVAGHGRLLAAKRIWEAGDEIPRCPRGRVPCVGLSDLTEEQRRAYILADNKLALNAGWDIELLKGELGELKVADFDLGLIGFSDEELADLLAPRGVGLTDPDSSPVLPEDPVSRRGDVWVLGRHRLVCGDATFQTDVDLALNGVTPHLMVTDPPYGVEYDADWRNRVDRANGKPYGARAVGLVKNDDRSDWRDAWALFPGDVAYCWHADRHASSVQASLEACDFEIRCQIIWAKTRFAISRGHYHWQHEPCWYAVRHGANGHWGGDRSQTTLWTIDHQKSETGHSTQKPVECMRRPIENNSSPGQAVYEPFSGSGTTIIAAEMTGRACHAIELNEAYVDVAVKRWQDFTGKPAVLEGAGRTFNELAEDRGVKISDEGSKADTDAPEAGDGQRRAPAA